MLTVALVRVPLPPLPIQVPEKWLQPSIVLLDVGMVTCLARQEQLLLTQMFRAFSSMDGASMARAALAFSGEKQTCPDPQASTRLPLSRPCVSPN